ncbi:hypothetical protein M3Y98_01002500 [Aphelenchoides besseyi]|nr:hypothetical protein M3Y98_01002500 [Aphelenchoides besseyi]
MGEKEAKGITQEALDEYGKQYPDFKLTLKKYVNGRKQVVAGMRYWLELSVLSHPKQLFCAPTTKQLNVTVYQPPGETKPNFKYYEEPNFARCQH